MKHVLKVNDVTLEVVEGDITSEDCDAIVNPANSLMIMGGGVAGAIKRRGGVEIEEEALKKAPVPVGEAISTTGGRLRAKYVIHAPTMEKPAMRIPSENVYKATRAALLEAEKLGVRCVALPAMGAGVGGVPVEEPVKTMFKALRDLVAEGKISKLKVVRFVAWGSEAYSRFLAALTKIPK